MNDEKSQAFGIDFINGIDLDEMSESDLVSLKGDINAMRGVLGTAITKLNTQIGLVQSKIDRRSSISDGVVVTDHAVIRYLERVKGVDITAIREEIAAFVNPHRHLNPPMVKINGGTIALQGNKVVTVLPKGQVFRQDMFHWVDED